MDAMGTAVDLLRDFARGSVRLVKRCQKPDRKEFLKVVSRTAIGFAVMGVLGCLIKIAFIPINYYIVSG